MNEITNKNKWNVWRKGCCHRKELGKYMGALCGLIEVETNWANRKCYYQNCVIVNKQL